LRGKERKEKGGLLLILGRRKKSRGIYRDGHKYLNVVWQKGGRGRKRTWQQEGEDLFNSIEEGGASFSLDRGEGGEGKKGC